MFDSDLEQEATKLEKRRTFLTLAASAVAGGLLWSLRRPTILAAAHSARGTPGEVTIVQFSDDGKRLQKVRVAKVVKSDE